MSFDTIDVCSQSSRPQNTGHTIYLDTISLLLKVIVVVIVVVVVVA